jgi:hypothetical protein
MADHPAISLALDGRRNTVTCPFFLHFPHYRAEDDGWRR